MRTARARFRRRAAIVFLASQACTSVTARWGNALGFNSRPYVAVVGSLSLLQGYLNEEFHLVVATLASRASSQQWRTFAVEAGRRRRSGLASPSWDGLKRRAITLHGRVPSALLSVVKFHWDYVALAQLGPQLHGDAPSVKIIAYVDDLHWYDDPSQQVQMQALTAANVVLSTYAHVVPLMYPGLGRDSRVQGRRPRLLLAWMPHATTPQFFIVPRDKEALIKQVLLAGATSQDWYPYRYQVQRTCISGEKRDPRFAVLHHPGYSKFQGNPSIGRGFATQLNQYAACMTDGLHLNYTIAKITEIPAAGCLLLVNAEMLPFMARLGLFDGVHFLAYKNADELRSIAGWVVNPRNARATHAMRRRAQGLVWRRHLVAHRAASVDAVLNVGAVV